MDWSTILSEIQRCLKLPSTGGHWTDAELLRRANIGQRIVCRETDCLQKTTSSSSVSGTGTYDKASDCLKILRVTYDSEKVYGVTREQLDMMAVNGQITAPWQTDTDTEITNYVEDITSITLYPIPSETGKAVAILHTYAAPDIVDTTDIPFDSKTHIYDYHDMLKDYVVWQCLLEDQNEFYAVYAKMFTGKMASLKRAMHERPDEMLTFDMLRKRNTTDNNPLPLWDR